MRGTKIFPRQDKELVNSLLMAISTPVEIDESQFELLADLTSSAPAFFTAIMQEYASTAVLKGKISLELAGKTDLANNDWYCKNFRSGWHEF